MKTIDKLPKSVLVEIAKIFGFREPEKVSSYQLAQFISDSCYNGKEAEIW